MRFDFEPPSLEEMFREHAPRVLDYARYRGANNATTGLPTYVRQGGILGGSFMSLSTEDEYELVDPEKLAKGVQLPPIIRLVNLILSDAASANCNRPRLL